MIGEAEFLALTARMRLDWTTPLGELKARYGVRRWFDFVDVIDVPLGALTPSIAGPFYVHHRPQDEPWPPGSYVKEAFADDVLTHHDALTCELTSLLGPGERNPSINVVGTTWRIGVFTVQTLTFLKREPVGPNPLYERHPELWQRTSVTLEAAHFSFAPDETLTRFASLRDLSTIAAAKTDAARWFGPLVKRNPQVLRASIPERAVVVRVDSASRTIALSAQDLSLVAERDRCKRLRLLRVAPARGPGYASIEVDYLHPLANGAVRGLTLFHDTYMDSLDEVAPQLARVLDLPLEIQSGLDD